MAFYLIVAIFFYICGINSQNIQQSDLEKIIQENLHGDARYRTNYKLIALLIGDLVKNEKSVQERRRVQNCIALSTSRKIYGRCVESLIEKQYNDLTRRQKFLSSNHHRRKKSIIDGDNNQVTWSSMFDHVSEFLYHVIKSAKSTIGGLWFSSSNDTQTLISDDQVPDDPNIDTNQTANDVINLINQLLNSPLVAMKHNLSLDQIFQNPDHQKNNVRILSPRLFPLFESKSNTADSFLSPDILALYDDRSSSSNSFSQILRNFSQSNHNDKFWSKFLSELSGVSDLIKLTKKTNLRKFLLKKSKIETGYDGIDIATNKIYDIYDKMKVSDIYKMLNAGQMTQLNSKGYVFMENDQVDKVYSRKNTGSNSQSTGFDIKRYKTMSDIDKQLDLLEFVSGALNLKRRKKRAIHDDPSSSNGTLPLSNETLASKNNPPCVGAPYLGGTALSTYIGAPQVLCPSAFSYIVLGPLILSPYILSPYILGPFILSPLILTPFILSPYALSPNILTPVVLSPSILNPTLLSPNILSPTLLSPTILSPSVLGPSILSPGVLSPSVSSDGLLAPAILSPCVLCRRKKKRR